MDELHKFRCSKPWLDLSLSLRIKSNGYCSHCHKQFPISFLRAHHIKELTIENVNDPKVALNPDNIIILCHDCHNKIHHRFSQVIKKVYIICGAPCSGKTTYVEAVATRYDLIVDLDKIQQAIANVEPYDKPMATKKLAFDIRDMLYEKIAFRYGIWENAYVIACLPTQLERMNLIERLNGAELIDLETSYEECIKRAHLRSDNQTIIQSNIDYINDYFSKLE